LLVQFLRQDWNKKVRNNKTTAENLERKFGQGGDVLDCFDLTQANRPLLGKERINLDMLIRAICRSRK